MLRLDPTRVAPLAVLASTLGACASPSLERRYDEARQPFEAQPLLAPTEPAPLPALSSGPVDWSAITRAVLDRNPRLESMRAAWKAMLDQVPQVTASPDPTLEVGLAPLAVYTGRGQRLGYRQPLAWAATLDARGEVVLAEAAALAQDREAMARMLVAAAHEALVELGASAALRRVYHDHHHLMDTLRRGVLARMASGRGMPEDAVRAEAEIVMVDRELVAITRIEKVAQARLGALLRLPGDAAPLGEVTLPPLPPAPPPLEALLAEARLRRPELLAAARRVEARLANERVADTMGRPMIGVGAEVSTMGDDPMMWPMLMVMIELPLASAKRDAMRDEARAMTLMTRHEAAALTSDIEAEVKTRAAELEAARASLALTRDTLVPVLQQRVDLVQASYAANRQDFDAVVMAAEALLEARLDVVAMEREAHMAAIALEVALGRLLGEGTP